MDQTPVHEQHNPDLLKLIPITAKKLIEVGCSSGALAREFKKLSIDSHYLGIEIDAGYAELAHRHCDEVTILNIEDADDVFWAAQSGREIWIFGDTLEHFKNPWRILEKIFKVIPENGMIIACIPNAQHWSMQARLSIGDFRYEEEGLMDKTHLRWFTRQTIVEMFDLAGFDIEEGFPRIFDEPRRDSFLPIIAEMAKAAGADPELAVADSIPLQYVVRAVKKK